MSDADLVIKARRYAVQRLAMPDVECAGTVMASMGLSAEQLAELRRRVAAIVEFIESLPPPAQNSEVERAGR